MYVEPPKQSRQFRVFRVNNISIVYRTKRGGSRTNDMTKTLKNHRDRQKEVFSDEHFKSADGMLTTVWGPGIWHFLHTMSFNYPVEPTDQDKLHYRNFILNLRHVLPCGKCRMNLTKNFKKLPLHLSDMKSRDTFSLYIYNLHETVNEMLCKKSGLSFEDVKIRYENFRARCKSTPKSRTLKRERGKAGSGAGGPPKPEKGCTEPIRGEKSKCVLKIVPVTKKCETFQIENSCLQKRVI